MALIVLVIVVKRIVCNETFKNLLAEHLQEKGMKLEELKEKYMDAAFKDARYDYTETEVGSSAVHEYPPEVQNIDGTPTDHVNGSDEPLVEQYEKEIEDTEGCELSLTKSSGWNVSGGLSAVYQGIGAAATMEYTTCQSETVTKFKGKRQAQRITKTISIPPKSRRSVVLARRDQRKECPAKNIKLIFPKNAKIKCKVHDNRDADPTRHTKVNPFVKDVLKDYIEDTAGGNQLTAKLEGKYVWVETSIYVDVGAAQPIDP